MTLLSMVQNILGEQSLPQPAAVIGSTDFRVIQCTTLLRKALIDIKGRHDWTVLITSVTPTLTAVSNIATYTLPSDFGHFVVDSQIWHVARRRQVIGPVSTQEWQQLTIGVTPTAECYWRRLGTTIEIAGVSTGDQINYEYISTYPVASSGGTPKAAFTADDDVSRIDEGLVEMSLLWRFEAANRLDYGEDMKNFERQLEISVADDRGIYLRRRRTSDSQTMADYRRNFPFTITP